MKENFISRFEEEDNGAKVNVIDANKTLIINQFTMDASSEPELFEGAKTMADVEFENENGECVPETLHFNEMKDFDVNGGKGKLVTNSEFLSDVKDHLDTSSKIRKQIEQNGKLRSILKDNQAREELKNLLQSMLDE